MIESIFSGIVGCADFLQQFLHEQAGVASGVIRHTSRCRRVDGQRPIWRVNRGETGGEGAEAAFVRITPRSIEDSDLYARPALAHLAQNIIKTEAIALDLRLRPNLRVNRNEISLTRRLDAKPTEVKQSRRARLNFCKKCVEGAAHRLAIGVLLLLNFKVVPLQLLGERAGVLDRARHRCAGVRISGIADDQRDALAAAGARRRRRRLRKRKAGAPKRNEQQREPERVAQLEASAALFRPHVATRHVPLHPFLA